SDRDWSSDVCSSDLPFAGWEVYGLQWGGCDKDLGCGHVEGTPKDSRYRLAGRSGLLARWEHTRHRRQDHPSEHRPEIGGFSSGAPAWRQWFGVFAGWKDACFGRRGREPDPVGHDVPPYQFHGNPNWRDLFSARGRL